MRSSRLEVLHVRSLDLAEGDLGAYKRVWQVWDVTLVFPLHTLNNRCAGRKKCDFYLNSANGTARIAHLMTTAYLIGLEIEMRITTDDRMHVLFDEFPPSESSL